MQIETQQQKFNNIKYFKCQKEGHSEKMLDQLVLTNDGMQILCEKCSLEYRNLIQDMFKIDLKQFLQELNKKVKEQQYKSQQPSEFTKFFLDLSVFFQSQSQMMLDISKHIMEVHKDCEKNLINLNVNLSQELLDDICETKDFERLKEDLNQIYKLVKINKKQQIEIKSNEKINGQAITQYLFKMEHWKQQVKKLIFNVEKDSKVLKPIYDISQPLSIYYQNFKTDPKIDEGLSNSIKKTDQSISRSQVQFPSLKSAVYEKIYRNDHLMQSSIAQPMKLKTLSKKDINPHRCDYINQFVGEEEERKRKEQQHLLEEQIRLDMIENIKSSQIKQLEYKLRQVNQDLEDCEIQKRGLKMQQSIFNLTEFEKYISDSIQKNNKSIDSKIILLEDEIKQLYGKPKQIDILRDTIQKLEQEKFDFQVKIKENLHKKIKDQEQQRKLNESEYYQKQKEYSDHRSDLLQRKRYIEEKIANYFRSQGAVVK